MLQEWNRLDNPEIATTDVTRTAVGAVHLGVKPWQSDAACKGRTALFFPRRAERPEARERREIQADKLCAQCVVAAPCREFARENHEYGFWAGESEEERHRLGFTVSAPIGVRIRSATHAQSR